VTELDNGYNGFSIPCVITDIAMGGVNITYPKGSRIKEVLLKGRDQFRLSFKLPQNGEEINLQCDARRIVEVNKEIQIGAMIQNPNPRDLSTLKQYLN
jgi:hypothetical protein